MIKIKNYTSIIPVIIGMLMYTSPARATTINFNDSGLSHLSVITNFYADVQFHGISNPFPIGPGPFPAPLTVPAIIGGAVTWDPRGTAHNFAVGLGQGDPGNAGILMTFANPISKLTLVGKDFGNGIGDTEEMTLTAYDASSNFIGQKHFVNQFAIGAIRGKIEFSGMKYVAFNYTNVLHGFYGIDDLDFTLAKEFNVSFSAFIPHDNVPAPPFTYCFIKQPLLKRQDLYYRGDTRNFGVAETSYRVREKVTVIPDSEANESVNAKGLKKGSIKMLIGQTRSYAEDSLLDFRIDNDDDDGISDDCMLFHQSDTASINSGNPMKVTVDRINEHKVEIHFIGGPSNPLSALASVFASLDWNYTITIDTSGDKPHWTLEGNHDGFPAYEIYINDEEIYSYSPGSPPYTLRNTGRLMGPLDQSVNKAGDLQ